VSIHVRNWEKFQHRDVVRAKAGRAPVWIKLYTELLSDEAFLSLSEHRRLVLICVWLEYARTRARLPLDTRSLSRRLQLRVTKADLEALNHAGFLEFLPAGGQQPASLEERRVEVPSYEGTPAPQIPPMVKTVKPKGARTADLLWEALVRSIGRSPQTEIERKRWNAALKELRDAEATPDDVEARAAAYRREWPEVELTPHGLAANWSRFSDNNVVPLRRHKCPVCDIGFTTQAKRDEHLENIHDDRRPSEQAG
jgi:hypothetical protein